MIKADYVNFLLNWVEWYDVSNLGTDGVLKANQAANYFIGDYAVTAAKEVFFNPIKTNSHSAETHWPITNTVWGMDERNPADFLPGSMGEGIFFPNITGPYNATQTTTMDSQLVLNYQQGFRQEYEEYEQQKETYIGLRKVYKEAIEFNNNLDNKPFVNAFEPRVKVPERPCQPNQPIQEYIGPSFNLE